MRAHKTQKFPRVQLTQWSALMLCIASGAALAQNAPTPTPTPAPAPAPEAAPAAPSLERVEITGSSSEALNETALRRESTAAKIIIGREEITRMGDGSITEVLKRLPGVTLGGRPGRGGDVRMRGLGGGYTQILLNGERVGPGFSLDTLTPEQIERIEVLRAPTAETGAQAIAGTINIVLREDVRKRLNAAQITLSHEDTRWQPSATWTRADQLGDFSYSLSGSANRSDRNSANSIRTTTTTTPIGDTEGLSLDQIEDEASRDRRDSLSLNGRLQWKLGGQDTLSVTPFLLSARNSGHASGTRTLLAGTSPNPYDTSVTESSGGYDVARVNAQWQTRLANRARLEIKGSLSAMRYGSDSTRQESQSGSASRELVDRSRVRDQWWSQGGKYSQSIDGEHLLAAGWDIERGQRQESRSSVQTSGGTTTSLLDDGSGDLQARSLRTALWAQDEWSVSPTWSLHGGLRWEGISSASDSGGQRVRNQSSVLSPLLHALWRLEEGSKDQIRASLTRSYRAPTLQNLVARRSISSRYPTSGGNEPTSPDRIGNPDLKPELATGLDVAYEHYLSGGGLLSASVFTRRIENLIRNITTLQNVSYSGTQRWVSQPQNIGTARTSGIELEAKFRLAEVIKTAANNTPALDLRSNLSVFRSKVEGVSGPDNRLDQQPDWTANLGADYRVPGWPLMLGGNLNYTPTYAVQQSDLQRNDIATKRVVDLYALWTFNPTVQLRLSAANLVPLDWRTSSTVTATDSTGTTRQTAINQAPGETYWGVKLELKL